MVEKYEPSNTLKNITEKKKDAIISKTKKPFKQLPYLESTPEVVEPKISDKTFEELLESSLKFYDHYAQTF